MCNLNILLVILSIVVYTKCVGEMEDGFEQKRYELNLQTCIENFDIHSDKIIRTQDSVRMGAKYLNEAEVTARDECVKLCCDTPTCDVFVYEQKNPGSCYLFHCGSPEDFKCKFAQHRNYTSAVLTQNHHQNEMENQIKLTKHEEELNRLRKPEAAPGTTLPSILTTGKVPGAQETKINHTSRSQCSRYQFECRSTGECIAIYNACDGIPQCTDGSDEAPELDCPTIAGTTRSKSPNYPSASVGSKMSTSQNTPVRGNVPEGVSPEPHPQQTNKQMQYRPPSPPQWPQSLPSGYRSYGQSLQNEKMPEFPSGHQKLDPQQQLANQAKIYGREGEALSQQYQLGGMPWQGYQSQPHQQEERSRIFTHTGSGLVAENSDRYNNRQYHINRNHHGQIPNPYNSDLPHSEYRNTGGNNNGYYNGGGPMYYPGPNTWPQRQQHAPGLDDVPQRSTGMNIYGSSNTGPGMPDYYYEDSQMRGRVPVQQDPRGLESPEPGMYGQKSAPSKEAEKQETLKTLKTDDDRPKTSESVKKASENSAKHKGSEEKAKTEVPTSSAKPEHPSRAVAYQLTINEDDFVSKDIMGENERPSGAILSLTLGMCITAILVTLVGCRLRLVKRRMRRGGKSPYAHDPDFLVNGMYL